MSSTWVTKGATGRNIPSRTQRQLWSKSRILKFSVRFFSPDASAHTFYFRTRVQPFIPFFPQLSSSSPQQASSSVAGPWPLLPCFCTHSSIYVPQSAYSGDTAAASRKMEIPLPELLLSSALPLTVSDSATAKRQPWPKPCYWETGEDCPRKPFNNSGKAEPRTYWPFQDCIWVWCTGSYRYVSRFWATVKQHVSCVLQPLCCSVCSIV